MKDGGGRGARAVILAPTRELAHQIHNECLKLAAGRKWRVVLFSKATASTMNDKNVRDKVGMEIYKPHCLSRLTVCRYHYQYTPSASGLHSGRKTRIE